MTKKNEFIKVIRAPTQSKNTIEITNPEEFDFRNTIKFFRDEEEIHKYMGLDKVETWRNTAIIFLDIDKKKRKPYEKDEKTEITFWLKREAWESKENLKKCEKEAYIDYLNKAGVITQEFEYGQDIEYEFTILDGSSIGLKVWKKGEKGNSTHVALNDTQIKEIVTNFYQLNPISLKDTDEYKNIKKPKEDGSKFWTGGRIFLAFVFLAIILLLIFFWKKIWRWIKGESSQEKKVQEQIDIF